MPKFIDQSLTSVDKFQQKHSVLGFPYAVIKKYGDDEAGYEAALITYYGFLSLFPLLIVLTAVLQIVLKNHENLHHKIVTSLNQYFPVVGQQIEKGLHGPHKTGLALVVGLLFMLYGARGIADAFRHAVDRLWQTPKSEKPSFPVAVFDSLKLIIFGAGGLIAATLLSSFATSLGRDFIFRILAIIISTLVLYGVFILSFTWAASSKHIGYRDFKMGALFAAIGIQFLQIVGGFVITHQLKNLSTLYGAFALVLGILFWIYLQAQIVLYSMEIDTVRKLKLWPRSITQKPMTSQDKKAYSLYPQKERFHSDPPEEIDVKFRRYN
jgi:membrane protein